MSLFKKTVQNEVNAIFLNPEEFAQEILFDGLPVWAVIDDSAQSFATREADGLADASGLGLLEGVRTVYVKDGDLPCQVQPEQHVTLAGVDKCGGAFGPHAWQILDVQHEDGVMVLKMTRVFA